MSPGDWVVYYAPRTAFRDGAALQAFTAIGRVKPGAPYAYDMGGGFVPMRRDVDFVPCQLAPIKPLIERLTFIRNKRSWGYAFRSGLIEIDGADFATIASAMGVDFDRHSCGLHGRPGSATTGLVPTSTTRPRASTPVRLRP
jgi:hypothetical protein